ncbi:MAG: HI0074 family nucleotidyltransferase substrate-binding subunit [Oceanobacter sp.]
MLQTESFAKAIASLERALQEYQREPNEFVLDAGIHRFECTYDLSHKMLKRHLEMTAANPAELDGYSFQQLIRTGAEKSLLANSWNHWSQYRLARNITSHSYNEARALEVFAQIPAFLLEAQYLLNQLNTKQHDV